MKYPIAFILRDHKAQDNFACRFDFMISQKQVNFPGFIYWDSNFVS